MEDAKKRLYEWWHHFSELCDRETNDTIVSIYCKLEIYIIRFCLIIQIVRWTCGECGKTYIDLLTVERAIKLTEFLKESALSVQNILNENALNSQQQTIVNLLPPSFTTAQAIQIAELNGMRNDCFYAFSMTTSGLYSAKRSMENIQRLTRDIFVGFDIFQEKTAITTKVTHKTRNKQ